MLDDYDRRDQDLQLVWAVRSDRRCRSRHGDENINREVTDQLSWHSGWMKLARGGCEIGESKCEAKERMESACRFEREMGRVRFSILRLVLPLGPLASGGGCWMFF